MTRRRVRRPHRRRRLRAALPDRRDDGHRPRPARLHLPARARRRHRGDRHHPRPRGPHRRAAVGAARAGGDERPRDLRRPADGRHGRAPSSTSTGCARPSSRCSRPARRSQAGPFEIELVHLTHSIPDMAGVILRCELGTVLFTGDYKFDQTPVGGAPADVSRLAELGRDGVLLLCGDSTNADRPGIAVSASRPSGRTSSASSPAARAGSSSRASPRTSTACSRSSTPPWRSAARSAWSGARCARTSTSGGRWATSSCPRGRWSRRASSTTGPTTAS